MKKLLILSCVIVLGFFTCYSKQNYKKIEQHSKKQHQIQQHFQQPYNEHNKNYKLYKLHEHHNHKVSFWGKGGRNFWPAFFGGIATGIVVSDITTPTTVTTSTVITPTTTVITQPVPVWIDGCYVNQIQNNGTIIRIWNPGHWEYR